jgi:hypothetical protein
MMESFISKGPYTWSDKNCSKPSLWILGNKVSVPSVQNLPSIFRRFPLVFLKNVRIKSNKTSRLPFPLGVLTVYISNSFSGKSVRKKTILLDKKANVSRPMYAVLSCTFYINLCFVTTKNLFPCYYRSTRIIPAKNDSASSQNVLLLNELSVANTRSDVNDLLVISLTTRMW